MKTTKATTLSFRRYAEMLDMINAQREYREDKAEQYPDDKRNRRSADGLHEMVLWFSKQDNDNPLMVRLANALEALYADPDTSFTFEPSVDNQLARFRFHHYRPETCEEFFEAMIDSIESHVAVQS